MNGRIPNSPKTGKKPIAYLICTLALAGAVAISGFSLAGCSTAGNNNSSNEAAQKEQRSAQPSVTGTVTKDAKYGCANTSLTAADLEAAGFELGDSCNITFSNGYTLTDVPYYNGYYVKYGEPVMVAYPNNEFVLITLNNIGLFDAAGLEDGMSVTIAMNTPDEDDATQEALSQVYSNDKADYASDEQFCNFRALTGGNLKENFLFRGASPVDNSRDRAAATDSLLKSSNIATIIDLADSESDIQGYFASASFNSPYVKQLYSEGCVALVALGSGYSTEAYQQSVAEGMRALVQNGGPAYIHCMEGKDRTGFVCMLLEALAGASYDEMLADYMKTYENYYGITQSKTPEKYSAVADLYFEAFAEFLLDTANEEELTFGNYEQAATNYLLSGGMSPEEVAQLKALITR